MCLVGEKVREKKNYFEENNKEEVENIDTLFLRANLGKNIFYFCFVRKALNLVIK